MASTALDFNLEINEIQAPSSRLTMTLNDSYRSKKFISMKTKKTVVTSSPQETINYAKRFAADLKPGTVLCLEGDLGSGKTTFVKGIAGGLGLKHPEQVKSPTFVLMHIYQAKMPLYHFDCYRLDSTEELENIGFQDFVNDPHAISCVEWAEKAGDLIPQGTPPAISTLRSSAPPSVASLFPRNISRHIFSR